MELPHDLTYLSGSFRGAISFSTLLADESIHILYGKHFSFTFTTNSCFPFTIIRNIKKQGLKETKSSSIFAP
jgi:hypothetical protein